MYRIDRTVCVVDAWGLDIRGNGSRLFTDDAVTVTEKRTHPYYKAFDRLPRQHLLFEGGGDLVMSRLHIRGPHPNAGRNGYFDLTREHQHALQLRGVKGMCVVGCEFSHPFGDLVYLKGRKVGPSGTEAGNDWSEDVWLSEMDLHHSGRQGITFQGVRRAVFARGPATSRSRIWEIRRSTFEFEPLANAYNGADSILIDDVEIGAGRFAVASAHGSGPVNNVTIQNCYLTRSMAVTVHDQLGARRSGWHILDNLSVPTPAAVQDIGSTDGKVMDFTNVDGVEVCRNVQPVQPGRNMALVQTKGCTAVEVDGNDVYEMNRAGARGRTVTELRS